MIRLSIVLILLGTTQLLISGCTKKQQELKVVAESSELAVLSESKVLSAVDKLHNRSETPSKHMPLDDVVFSRNGRGVAYIAENSTGQFVVHNDKADNTKGEISHLIISPDGQRVSYSVKLGNYYLMVSDGIKSNPYIDVYDSVYSPDNKHVAYLAEGLDRMMKIVLDGKPIDSYVNVVSSNFFFSHDSGLLIYHVRPEKNERASLVLYSLKTGTKSTINCLDTTVVMNEAMDHIAAVVPVDGKQAVVDFNVASPDKVHQSATYDLINNLSLSRNGKSVAFTAGKSGKIYLVMNGREYLLPSNLAVPGPPILSDNGTAASIALEARNGEAPSSYLLYQTDQRFNGNKIYSSIREQVYSSTGSFAHVAEESKRFFIVINGKPGPVFDAVVAPMFTPDGRKLIYRARDGAERMVVIANADGTEHQRLPSYEMVFPAGFTADGRSVGYGVKEGNKLMWKVDKL